MAISQNKRNEKSEFSNEPIPSKMNHGRTHGRTDNAKTIGLPRKAGVQNGKRSQLKSKNAVSGTPSLNLMIQSYFFYKKPVYIKPRSKGKGSLRNFECYCSSGQNHFFVEGQNSHEKARITLTTGGLGAL